MTINNQANRDVDFPVSYDWISNKTHGFRPRDFSDDMKFMAANMFLAMDKGFQHILRKCATSWIVAITFGKDTVYLNLYDTEAVDNPRTQQISTSVNLNHAIVVEVSRDPASKVMIVKPVEAARAKRAVHTGAFLYSSRCLRPTEQQMLVNIQQPDEADAPQSQEVEPVLAKRQHHLSPSLGRSMNKWWLRLRLRMCGLQQQVIPTDEYFEKVSRRRAKIEDKRQKAMAREMRELLEGEGQLLKLFKNQQPIIFDVRPHLGTPAIVVYDPRQAAKYRADSVARRAKTQPAFRPRLQQHGHFRFLYQDDKLITINQHAPAFDIVVDEPVLVYNPYWLFHPTTQQQLRDAFVYQ